MTRLCDFVDVDCRIEPDPSAFPSALGDVRFKLSFSGNEFDLEGYKAIQVWAAKSCLTRMDKWQQVECFKIQDPNKKHVSSVQSKLSNYIQLQGSSDGGWNTSKSTMLQSLNIFGPKSTKFSFYLPTWKIWPSLSLDKLRCGIGTAEHNKN